jgi:hypoxanthine phosphoribosyltransferase
MADRPHDVVYSAERIAARVGELGRDISAAYSVEDRLLVLGLLKGSFIFMADLVRALTSPVAPWTKPSVTRARASCSAGRWRRFS